MREQLRPAKTFTAVRGHCTHFCGQHLDFSSPLRDLLVPGENYLHVWYFFRGRMHKVVVGDRDELLAPMRSHVAIQRVVVQPSPTGKAVARKAAARSRPPATAPSMATVETTEAEELRALVAALRGAQVAAAANAAAAARRRRANMRRWMAVGAGVTAIGVAAAATACFAPPATKKRLRGVAKNGVASAASAWRVCYSHGAAVWAAAMEWCSCYVATTNEASSGGTTIKPPTKPPFNS